MSARLIHRAGDLARPNPGAVRGRRVLLAMAAQGNAVSEALLTFALLQGAGVSLTVGRYDAGPPPRLDSVTVAMAWASPGSPGWRAMRRSRREGWLSHPVGLAALQERGELDAFLDGFDALIVPGGHGAVFGAWILSALLETIVQRFLDSGRVIGLACHAVAAGRAHAGREVTCWPAAYERPLGALPFVGRYFVPLGAPAEDIVARRARRVHTALPPWRMPHVVIDGRLVTAWGPWSSRLFAQALLEQLSAVTPAWVPRGVAT